MTVTVPAAIRAAAAQRRRQHIVDDPVIRPGDLRVAATLPDDEGPVRRLVLVTHVTVHTGYVSGADGCVAIEPQAELAHCLPLAGDGDWDGGPPLSQWALPDWLLLEPSDTTLVWPAAVVPMPFRVLPGQLSSGRYAHLPPAVRRAAWRTVWSGPGDVDSRVGWQGTTDARRPVIELLFADMRSIGRHATHVEFADLDGEPHRDACPCSRCTVPSGRVIPSAVPIYRYRDDVPGR